MIGGMLASASAIAGASLVAVLAAGGTYALWSGERPLPEASIRTGPLGLTVNGAATATVDGTAWSRLLPGDIVSQQVTIKNVGTVPETVTVSTTGGYGPLLVHAAKGACGATITGTSSTVSPTTLGEFAAAEQSVVCLQDTMPGSAPAGAQGTSQSFTITFATTKGS
jgi:hypothetical protein